ncbi:nitrosoguanidine resistance protein [Pseudohyphozyma bogoriensis]|nr:nitrosoguanidine resistance protein [Pseudohyphozyma bogoriensis]
MSSTNTSISNTLSDEKGQSRRASAGGVFGKGTGEGVKALLGMGAMFTVVFWFYVVDFDGGAVGAALLGAVGQINGLKTYPNFITLPANSTTPEEVTHMVWEGKAWGAMWSAANASSLFNAALASEDAASSYVPSSAYTYTGLEVRYATVWASSIKSTFAALEVMASDVFASQTIVPFLTRLNGTQTLGTSQAKVLAAPLSASYLNLAPFPQGDKAVLNTVGFVLPILFVFFFILPMNMIFERKGVYRNNSLHQNLLLRFCVETVWTLIAGISVIGWSLTFKENYTLPAKNVFALFAVSWVSEIIYFNLLDAIISFAPMPLVAPLTTIVIILSVAGSAYPLEGQAKFFRIHYAFPSHAGWTTQITVGGHYFPFTIYRFSVGATAKIFLLNSEFLIMLFLNS